MKDANCRYVFDTLADEYKAGLAAAQAEATDKANGAKTYECTMCGERHAAVLAENAYQCFFARRRLPESNVASAMNAFRKLRLQFGAMIALRMWITSAMVACHTSCLDKVRD